MTVVETGFFWYVEVMVFPSPSFVAFVEEATLSLTEARAMYCVPLYHLGLLEQAKVVYVELASPNIALDDVI